MYPCKANLTVTGLHLLELGWADHRQRSGVEYCLFLLHQVEYVSYYGGLHSDELIVLILLEETAGITDLIADEVVEEPHRRGRAVEALTLED